MEGENITNNIKKADSSVCSYNESNSQTYSNSNENSAVKKTSNNNKNNKEIKNWTKEEDEILLEVASEFEFKNWRKISERLEGRTAIQCSARYKRIKPGIVKGSWSQQEDETLQNYIKRFGKNWSLISKYMPTRSGKQIRDRYLNTLDPTILKEKFSVEEDNKIVELYKKHGSSWSLIAKNFYGRTGDMIKNRFYSSLKKVYNFGNNLVCVGYKNNDFASEHAAANNNNSRNGIYHSNFVDSFNNNIINSANDFAENNNTQKQIKQEFKKQDFNEKKLINLIENTKTKTGLEIHNFRNDQPQGICHLNLKIPNDDKEKNNKNENKSLNNTRNKQNPIAENFPTFKTNKLFQTEYTAANTFTKQNENLNKIDLITNQKSENKLDNTFINKKRKDLDSNIFMNTSNLNKHKNNKINNDYIKKENSHSRIGKNSNSNSNSEFDVEISSFDENLIKNDDMFTKKYLNENSNLTAQQIISNNVYFMNLNNIKQNPDFNQNFQLTNPSNEFNNNNNFNNAELSNQYESMLNLASSEYINNNYNQNNNDKNIIDQTSLNNLLILANNLTNNSNQNQVSNGIMNVLNSNFNGQNLNNLNNNVNLDNNNINYLDIQMNLMINCLLESNHSIITYCRDDLENQLNILKRLLDFTNLKIEYLKKFNQNVQINSANSYFFNLQNVNNVTEQTNGQTN